MRSTLEEKSPLLRRGSSNTHGTKQRRHHMEEDSFVTQSLDDEDKEDRRGIVGKVASSVTQKLHRVSYRVLPPIDTGSTYEDTFNDEPWKCTFGTQEDDGIWMNNTDQVGTLMAGIVWILIVYSGITIMLLATHHHLPMGIAAFYCTVCTLALASHAKTTFTDPGAVPMSAIPMRVKGIKYHAMCSQCQTYKPNGAHHCRICNRCISRMDHHCPWMNNCIGAYNMKHFILFLVYTWIGSATALMCFMVNYFFCTSENCEFNGMEIQLVRAMSIICVGSLLFTSSMIMNVIFGILTGVGTIDRLKKKANDTWHDTTEEPTPLHEIFGVAPWWTWILPIDPLFADYDHIMGYSTRQRLLREEAIPTSEANISMRVYDETHV